MAVVSTIGYDNAWGEHLGRDGLPQWLSFDYLGKGSVRNESIALRLFRLWDQSGIGVKSPLTPALKIDL